MKAIILAAGYATRLYPLTKNTPKALLELDGKPIVEYIIDEINRIDVIDEIIIVSNHKFYDHFKTWADGFDNEKRIKIINDGTTNEETRLGAIGDILFAIEKNNIDEEIMVIAGDNYFTFSLLSYYEFYTSKNADCICVKKIDDKEDLKRYAIVSLDENRKVVDLEEKPENPKTDIAAFATYIYKKDTLPLFKKYIDEGNNKDAPGFFVEWLYKIKDVYAFEMNGECYDIGTYESYEQVQQIAKLNNKQQ